MDQTPGTESEILLEIDTTGQDPRVAFGRQVLAEACLAAARDMECYDYQIGRLIRKISTAMSENPAWAPDEEHLLRLVRSAAAGLGGRRERVWIASFDSGIDIDATSQTKPPSKPRRSADEARGRL